MAQPWTTNDANGRIDGRTAAEVIALDADTELEDLARLASEQANATNDPRWADVALGALALRNRVRPLMAEADRRART